jgi:two-component system OmpR family sensor kinase
MKRLWGVVLLLVLPWLLTFLVSVGAVQNLLFKGSFEIDLLSIVSAAACLMNCTVLIAALCVEWIHETRNRSRKSDRQQQREVHHQFLQRLDHEMKNPLTIIRVGLLNLQQEGSTSLDPSSSFARIMQQTKRLQQLVEDLRRLNELETYTLEISPIKLESLLRDALALACPDHETSRVELKTQQIPWVLSPVHGDVDLLLLAFRNLIDNALKYSSEADQIEIRANEDSRIATVEVADTGQGINEDDIPFVFEDLYRGQNARRIPGSGLGLALVQRVVQLHGGQIEIRSRIGQGTVVSVKLPINKS